MHHGIMDVSDLSWIELMHPVCLENLAKEPFSDGYRIWFVHTDGTCHSYNPAYETFRLYPSWEAAQAWKYPTNELEWRQMLSKQITRIYVKRHLDLYELGEAAGISGRAIHMYIDCEAMPNVLSMIKLAEALDFSLTDFLYAAEDSSCPWYFDMTDQEWKDLFGRNLRRIMLDRCLTQLELARAVEVSPASINLYLKGTRIPTAYTAVRLAEVLDCTLGDLTGFD